MSAYVPGIDEKDLKKIILSLQQLASGRSNAVGTVTLAAGTTTVFDDDCAEATVPILVPTSAAAAAAIPTTYISEVKNKSFTITGGTAGAVFLYALVG